MSVYRERSVMRLAGGECPLFVVSPLIQVQSSGRAAAPGLQPLRLPRAPVTNGTIN